MVTDFTVSELLRENQQGGRGGGCKITPPTRIRVKNWYSEMLIPETL